MNKAADINQIVSGLRDRAGDASGALKGWFENLNPDVKRTLVRGLAGAAVGGAATGGIAALTPRDREDRRGVIGPALTGALLGGTAAAALPTGLKMLGGGIRFSGEPDRPVGAQALGTLAEPFASNPLTTAAGVGTAWAGKDSLRALYHAMNNSTRPGAGVTPGAVKDTAAPVLTRLREALSGPAAKKFWSLPRDIDMGKFGPNMTRMRYSRGRLALIPLAIGAGIVGDKYLKGEW